MSQQYLAPGRKDEKAGAQVMCKVGSSGLNFVVAFPSTGDSLQVLVVSACRVFETQEGAEQCIGLNSPSSSSSSDWQWGTARPGAAVHGQMPGGGSFSVLSPQGSLP